MKGSSDRTCRDCFQAAALLSVILVLTAGLIYGYACAISSPYFLIKYTTVRGCRELTEKEVLALAALKPSQTIFSVNIKATARRVASHPWVRNVSVGREFPNRLVLEIQERSALALCGRDEDLYIVDREGLFFKKLEASDDVDVPVLTGYYRDGRLNKELFDKTVLLMKNLAASKNFPTLSAVSEINGNDVSGISLYTENGFCLKLGFDNYESKLQRLLPVITALNKKEMKRGLLSIDLRDGSKIYVERRGGGETPKKTGIKKVLST